MRRHTLELVRRARAGGHTVCAGGRRAVTWECAPAGLQPLAGRLAMRAHPLPSSDRGRRTLDEDFDWPPPHDDLSVHDLEGRPWSHLQAASNEAFAWRHGEPAPPVPARRAPGLQLGIVIAMSVALTFAAAWAVRDVRTPVPPSAGDTPPPAATVVAAPAEAAPPHLTIVATYPVDRPAPAAEAPPAPLEAAPGSAVDPQPTVAEEPPAAAGAAAAPAPGASTEVPLMAAGPAIDDRLTPAALIGAAAAMPAAAPSAPASARADEDIRELLRRYEAAYDRRDVATAAALWPSLDRRALSRAFASLDRQDVTFERCDIDASGARGSAVCVGTVRYVPRIGRSVEKEGRITWTFDLARSGDDWRITRLDAR